MLKNNHEDYFWWTSNLAGKSDAKFYMRHATASVREGIVSIPLKLRNYK